MLLRAGRSAHVMLSHESSESLKFVNQMLQASSNLQKRWSETLPDEDDSPPAAQILVLPPPPPTLQGLRLRGDLEFGEWGGAEAGRAFREPMFGLNPLLLDESQPPSMAGFKKRISTSKFCRWSTRSPNFPPWQNAPEEPLTLHVQVLPLCCCLQRFNGAL